MLINPFDKSSCSFSPSQVIGVLVVTLGIVLNSFATAKSMSNSSATVDSSYSDDFLEFSLGITILVIALIISCLLGQYQQHIYSKYGKHWEEGLFYMHFLGLPAFLFFYKDIVANVALYNASKPISLSLAFERWFPRTDLGDLLLKSYFLQNLEIPEQWLYIALNTVTQFICISGVSKLTSITTSVSVNLVLALRKFVSLVLSIIIFRNAFTWENWLGTILVFSGSILYSVF